MLGPEQLAALFWTGLAVDFLHYLLAAGTACAVLGWLLRERLRRRRIQEHLPSGRQMSREFLYSLSTVAIFTAVGLATWLAVAHGWIRIQWEVAEFGWLYTALSLPLTLVLHDAYFYWTHRLMHHPRIFRCFHRVHHRSRTPSPWAAYAFAPPEALVQALFQPAVLLILPLHPGVFYLFLVIMLVRNVIGHSGVEVFWRGFARGRFRWSTTVTHHDLHHQDPRGNYGLYFTWWDRWMGTEHADYHPTFNRVTSSA